MAEVLAEFTGTIVSDEGTRYRAQACGAPNANGLWEGWLEFIPLDRGEPLRSARETTQPNRQDAVYWATGLTAIYAQGSLRRTLNPVVRRVVERPSAKFDGPAPDLVSAATTPEVTPDAVLDPFSVYEKGEGLLRKELGALSAWHLVNIVRAYELSDEPLTTLNRVPGAALVELIVGAVRERTPAGGARL